MRQYTTPRMDYLKKAMTIYRTNVENNLKFWRKGSLEVKTLNTTSLVHQIDPGIEPEYVSFVYHMILEYSDTLKTWIYRVYCDQACLIEGDMRDLAEEQQRELLKLIEEALERR